MWIRRKKYGHLPTGSDHLQYAMWTVASAASGWPTVGRAPPTANFHFSILYNHCEREELWISRWNISCSICHRWTPTMFCTHLKYDLTIKEHFQKWQISISEFNKLEKYLKRCYHLLSVDWWATKVSVHLTQLGPTPCCESPTNEGVKAGVMVRQRCHRVYDHGDFNHATFRKWLPWYKKILNELFCVVVMAWQVSQCCEHQVLDYDTLSCIIRKRHPPTP